MPHVFNLALHLLFLEVPQLGQLQRAAAVLLLAPVVLHPVEQLEADVLEFVYFLLNRKYELKGKEVV